MLAVVLVLFIAGLVGVDVGIARDADDIGVLDRVHREDVGCEHLDGVLEQDELEAATRKLDDALALVRKRDEAEHDALGSTFAAIGQLGSLLGFLALLLFLASIFRLVVEAHEDVELAVLQMGERMARVDDLGREERHDVVIHQAGKVVALFIRQVFGAQMAYPLLCQRAANMLVVAFLNGIQLAATLVNCLDLLFGGHARL